jgi:hypothetical protein
MQPFDYRKAAAAMAAAHQADKDIERPIPPTIMPPGMRMPPGMASLAAGMPLMPHVSGVSTSLAASYQNTIASMANKVSFP